MCDEELDRETIDLPLADHTEGTAVEENRTESTCKVAGSYDSVVYCSVCDEELDRETIDLPLADHTEGTAVEENRTESTCKVAGSYDSVVYCSVCDIELSRDIVNLPLDSSEHGETEIRNDSVANCHENGYTGDMYCLDCNMKVADGEVTPFDANNHDGETEIKNAVTANCHENGYTGDTYCLGCNIKILDGEYLSINKDSHDAIVVDGAVEATCMQTGLTEGSHCASCNTVIVKQTVIEKTEHKYIVTSVVFDESKSGTITYKCSGCGDEKIEKIKFDFNDAIDLIEKAEKKLKSDKTSEEEKIKIKEALDEFRAFILDYVTFDENGEVVENNLPLNDSDVMSHYMNLFNSLNSMVDDNPVKDKISLIFEIVIMAINLLIFIIKSLRSM